MRRHEISSFSLGRLMGYKSFLMALIATALSAGTQRAQASIITGGISFNGNVTAYSDNSGSGPLATSLAAAESLGFGPSVVSDGANGSFSVIAANTPVTMHSPLLINPAVSIPASTPLWQVTVGPTTYSFTPTTPLVEVFVSANALILTDTGTFSDGTPADNNTNAYDQRLDLQLERQQQRCRCP
jgi:hypothetical protein